MCVTAGPMPYSQALPLKLKMPPLGTWKQQRLTSVCYLRGAAKGMCRTQKPPLPVWQAHCSLKVTDVKSDLFLRDAIVRSSV